MRKAILTVATAALVLGGSLVVLAQSEETTDEVAERGPIGHAIEEVLDELVADKTLTQEQADAVISALEAKRDEFVAEREQLRERLQEFWEDDQLTQEEIDQLPEWHRWSEMTDLLEDGVITRDELGEIRRGGRFGDGGFRRGH
jgi:polyhydroxyalkanoate synthesis regulator phasin